MQIMVRRIFLGILLLVALMGSGQVAFAAPGGIDAVEKYSQFLNIDLNNDSTNDFINWAPTNGTPVVVSDTEITGEIWGESVGWITLNPTNSGVTNTCDGELGGYAWGENTGWINFNPTNATGANDPQIDPNTGEITGTVWAQNYGWIQLDSPDGSFSGLVTDWTPTCDIPVNGVCGSADGGTFSSAPANGDRCSVGAVTSFTATGSGWTWSCAGTGGGTNDTCSASEQDDDDSPTGSRPSIRVIKNVVGGSLTPADFTMRVGKTIGNSLRNFNVVDLPGSPFPGNSSGETIIIQEPLIGVVVFEDPIAGYQPTFSGDCRATGALRFGTHRGKMASTIVIPSGFQGQLTCTITNTFTADPAFYGCKDPRADNYNSDPNILTNNALCTYPLGSVYGCKDIFADNFDPNPTHLANNALCTYPKTLYGCKDPSALNYDSNPLRLSDSTLCIFTDPSVSPPSPPSDSGDPGSDGSDDPWNSPGIKEVLSTFIDIDQVPLWVMFSLSAIGLLASIPGLLMRFGNLILTIAFGRKRMRGIVFDSRTKEPLDPAYVTVYDAITGVEVASQITDMEGRYGFVLKQGSYRIVAAKTHYQFPSMRLAGMTSDQVYDHLYFGQVFSVSDDETVVAMNIPMDPLGEDWNQQAKRKRGMMGWLMDNQHLWISICNFLFIIGFATSVIIIYFYPVLWNIVMVVLYVIIAILHALGYGQLTVGKVTKFKQPLPYSIVRAYNANLNHEIGHRVTNQNGGYYLLVPKNYYYVTIEERNPDGTYTRVYSSGAFNASQGIINKSFDL